MRRVAVCVLVWLAAFPAFAGEARPLGVLSFDDVPLAPGNSMPGRSLLLGCTPADHAVKAPNLFDRAAACKETVGAVVDALDAAATLAPLGRIYCPPGGSVHWLEAADAFVVWAREHPEQMGVPAGFLVVEALRRRWPCPERGM